MVVVVVIMQVSERVNITNCYSTGNIGGGGGDYNAGYWCRRNCRWWWWLVWNN